MTNTLRAPLADLPLNGKSTTEFARVSRPRQVAQTNKFEHGRLKSPDFRQWSLARALRNLSENRR